MRYTIQYSVYCKGDDKSLPYSGEFTFDPDNQTQRPWYSRKFGPATHGVYTPEQCLEAWLEMGIYGNTVIMQQE